ncbi:MAG: 4Fe-4S dicluster domain-containing protein [bacterium]
MIVLLCKELERLGDGLDLGEIEHWLGDREPEVEVRKTTGPCERPEECVNPDLKGADRLVLGLCSANGDRDEIHARARRLGLDPFAMEIVDLGAYCSLVHPKSQATDKAKLLLGAALAKARAFTGFRPENTKPVLSLDRQVTRRSLFTLPPVRYEAVPSVREEACAAAEGCRVCANLCPWEALVPSDDGRMTLTKAPCTGCGACVSICPREAIDFPGAPLAGIEAQIEVLLDTSPLTLHPRGILFLCPKGGAALQGLAQRGFSYPAGWLPVEVPCLGMVTPAWILHCLNQGAAAVGLLPCPREDCRFGQLEVIQGRVDYCRGLLQTIGGTPESVRLLDPVDAAGLAGDLSSFPVCEIGEKNAHFQDGPRLASRATGQTVLELARRYDAPLDRILVYSHSPLGVVEFEDGCTVCGACPSACPTGALALERDEEAVSISFDARACIGCEACVPVCPETVVRVEKVTDLRRLSQGRHVLYQGSEARCVKCGAPVAPRAMLDRLGDLLGGDAVFSAISRYCLECRKTLQ